MVVDICTNGFLNCTDIIGETILVTTEQTTGTLFITFFVLVLLFIAFGAIFRIKIEYSILLCMPILLALMSYYQEFLAIGSVILIYFAFLITKHFILK